MQNTIFKVKKSDLTQSEVSIQTLPNLGDGQVLLQIEKFALTANNITYAVIGEKFGYWKFFPTDESWGIVPVWGFAKVILSNHSEIQVGERFYGYYPTASHLLLDAGRVSQRGFVDEAAHRLELPAVYNFYSNVKQEAQYATSSENAQMIFRPLFTTSFVLDDFLLENNFFNAKNIILTSASSKTAFALAFLLAERKKKSGESYQIIGLTSEANLGFVKDLGCYDVILAYNKVNEIPKENSCCVDFAGNQPLLIALQNHLLDLLHHTALVGMVHWDKRKNENGEKVKGELFFAPTHIQQRNKDWGIAGFQQKLAEAWDIFMQSNPSTIEYLEFQETDALKEIYLENLKGEANPQKGYIFVWESE